MSHTCHALACQAPCPAVWLMCLAHWRLVAPALQAHVWATYRPGQEQTKDPSRAYLRAAARAIVAVAEHEGRVIPSNWRRMATG